MKFCIVIISIIQCFVIVIIFNQKIYKYKITYEFTLYLGEITLAKMMVEKAIHRKIKSKKVNLDFLSKKLKANTLFFLWG